MIGPAAFIYGVSKAATEHLTRAMAVTLGPRDIRVSSLSPGFVAAHLLRHCPDKETSAEEKSTSDGDAPKGRSITPQDIAEIVTFLAPDKARFINGENISADGGIRFRRSSPAEF